MNISIFFEQTHFFLCIVVVGATAVRRPPSDSRGKGARNKQQDISRQEKMKISTNIHQLKKEDGIYV